jgi:putative PIN family toxin of toxin-antitoxin system
MPSRRIVVDTNVIVSGLRSTRGASHRLLNLIGKSPSFEISLSVPLLLEYEDALKRQTRHLGLRYKDIDDVLEYLCSVATLHEIYYLWRPVLRDPHDDFVLELAVGAGCETIVTFNTRDFAGAETFGLRVERPQEFMKRIGEVP